MVDFDEENIKIIDGVKYINYDELKRVLNIPNLSSTARSRAKKNIVEDFSIRVFKVTHTNVVYNIEDVQRAIDEINSFYSSYYTKEELFQKISVIHVKKFWEGPTIKVPDKFMNTGKCAVYVYDKDVCGEIIKTILKNKGNEPDNIDINGEVFVSTEYTLKELDVYSSYGAALEALNCLENNLGINTVEYGSGDFNKYFSLNAIVNLKNELNDFYDANYLMEDVENLLPSTEIKKLNFIPLENKHVKFLEHRRNSRRQYFAGSSFAFNKEYIDSVVWDLSNNYLTRSEIAEIFNIRPVTVTKFKKEYNMETISINNTHGKTAKLFKSGILFHKKDIENLVKKKEDFYRKYMTVADIPRLFDIGINTARHIVSSLEGSPIPLYAKDREHAANTSNFYEKSVVEKAVEKYLKNKIIIKDNSDVTDRDSAKTIINISDIHADTPFNTYLARLEAYEKWEGFDDESIYTSKKWFNYVQGFLDRTISKGRTLNTRINSFVYSTIELKAFFLDLSKKKEVYAMTSSEINMGLNVVTTMTTCKHIYTFFREVYLDLVTVIKASAAFNMDDVKHPDVVWNKVGKCDTEQVYEIYGFEEYSEVFNYCTNVDMHVKKSLEEIKQGNYEYTSTWLYVMLHLNNAWRNGDVKSFPNLEISDLLDNHGIYSVDWFNYNRISLALGRAVIFRINEWEFTISKTQIKGAFFCSDELLPAFVTAVILLTLVNNSCGVKQDTLMRLENKYKEFGPPQLKSFFENMKLDSFTFGSKKFNKTVMTYVYYIANLSGDSKALIYSMKLRGHVNSNTTAKHYIKFDIVKIEALSRQLFARGEFGFIPSLLVQRLNGGQLSFDEVTNEVESVNNSFGDIVKINASIGFINSLRAERETIVNAISEMSLEQLQMKATEIFARKLPSKESTNVQCLFGDSECKRTELESCFECQYHIPSIYALTAICDSIKSDLIKYHNTNLTSVKFRLVQSINKKKVDIKAAINKYGLDYVYNCLGIEREEFKKLLASVPKPERLISLITSANN